MNKDRLDKDTLDKDMLDLVIKAQPDDVTCGPTCLHALYNYYQDPISLLSVIGEVTQFKTGGTLAVFLGTHALIRGYKATIYTYNLHIFDPTWFSPEINLAEKLKAQLKHKRDLKTEQATNAYLQFLELGGKIKYEELTADLLKRYLTKKIPILTGLSATYLYQCAREIPETSQFDDIKGEPCGHFVLIKGFSYRTQQADISDPLNPNPLVGTQQHYKVHINRLINAILLGIITYDANILIIHPKH